MVSASPAPKTTMTSRPSVKVAVARRDECRISPAADFSHFNSMKPDSSVMFFTVTMPVGGQEKSPFCARSSRVEGATFDNTFSFLMFFERSEMAFMERRGLSLISKV